MCECVYVDCALLIFSATVIVRSGGLICLKPVAMVLLMLSSVDVDFIRPCGVLVLLPLGLVL